MNCTPENGNYLSFFPMIVSIKVMVSFVFYLFLVMIFTPLFVRMTIISSVFSHAIKFHESIQASLAQFLQHRSSLSLSLSERNIHLASLSGSSPIALHC